MSGGWRRGARPVLLALLVAASGLAQVRVGEAHFSSGTEIYFGGGAGKTGSKQVGLSLDVTLRGAPPPGFFQEMRARFAADTCRGTQVRLEEALWKHARARGLEELPAPDFETLGALVEAGRLPVLPDDPEAGSGPTWWKYHLDGERRIRCLDHGSYRDPPAE